jgi:hypothetical protein
MPGERLSPHKADCVLTKKYVPVVFLHRSNGFSWHVSLGNSTRSASFACMSLPTTSAQSRFMPAAAKLVTKYGLKGTCGDPDRDRKQSVAAAGISRSAPETASGKCYLWQDDA